MYEFYEGEAEFDLSTTDVIFTLPLADEVSAFYFPRIVPGDGEPKGVKLEDYPDLRVVSITGIYEGWLSNLLMQAEVRLGFKDWKSIKEESRITAAQATKNKPLGYVQQDLVRAHPQHCAPFGADVHYRMPGMTDMAIEAWMSLAATGLWTGTTSGTIIGN